MLPREAARLLKERPADVAVKAGYDKLTDLHNGWIREMVWGRGDVTLQAHRGSFKTTCIGVSLADLVLLRPKQRIGFFRKTDPDVAEVLAAVANLLQTDWYQSLAHALYGHDLKLLKATQTELDTCFSGGVSGASQLMGMGMGGSITGKHFDRIFTDDIVTLRDRVSGAERRKTDSFYQELQNIRNRGGRIVNTGTPWHKDDTFRLMPNIRRCTCHESGLMTPEEIAAVKKSMSPSLFAANYELRHIADGEAMFKEPGYFADPSKLHDGIGHIDAAYGGADGTAFTALRIRDGLVYAHIRLWPGKHVDDCLPEIVRICRALRIGTLYMERNSDKGYLVRKVRAMGHPAMAYSENANKYIKISTHLRSVWDDVRILDCAEFPLDSEAVNQITDYTENAAHDDMPDSMASAVRQWNARPQIKTFREGA